MIRFQSAVEVVVFDRQGNLNIAALKSKGHSESRAKRVANGEIDKNHAR